MYVKHVIVLCGSISFKGIHRFIHLDVHLDLLGIDFDYMGEKTRLVVAEKKMSPVNSSNSPGGFPYPQSKQGCDLNS